MKHFIILTSLFIAPFLLLSGVVLAVVFSYGENSTVNKAISAQMRDSSVLYGCAFVDYGAEYKRQFATKIDPEILVLGTSRTMQINHQWFTPKLRFYNAGGGAAKINEFVPFLEETNANPKLLIIGLDQFFFNENWDNVTEYKPISFRHTNLTSIFFANFGSCIKEIISGRISIINPTSNIGVNASMKGNGFAADGSYNYGHFIKTGDRGIDNEFADTYNRIANGHQRFEWSKSVNQRAIEKLKEIIDYCKSHNIRLVAFLPPYAPSVNQKMDESHNYQYIWQIMPIVAPLFENAGYTIADFTDCSGFSTDDDYSDGFHGGTKVYKEIIDRIFIGDSTLTSYLK